MPGLKDRKPLQTVDKVTAATTPAECEGRAAEALAYAEEMFLIGSLSKANGLMALARGYLSLASAQRKRTML